MFSSVLAPLAVAVTSICPVVAGNPTTSFDIFPRTPAAGIDVQALAPKLSPNAKIYLPGTNEFDTYTTRWSNLKAPTPSIVVAPGTEKDVQHIMDYGIEIYMPQLNSVAIKKNGKTATIGGGIGSKNLIDTLWAAGKQTVTGCCECVSYLGPALGGGHGWLQGHHGLITDQFQSMNVVLANGEFKTIDSTSDLWWGMQGAGHNFGIVTSVTSKIYDIEHFDWAIETIVFSGDKVEEVYDAANKYILKGGNQSVEIQNWSYWQNDLTLDAERPVIVMFIIQEGATAVDPKYTTPFHDIGPLAITPQSGSYQDLAKWTGIALESPPCQDFGFNNPRFPIYISNYNVTAQRKAYDLYASAISGADNPYFNSIFMFEDYPSSGVRDRDNSASAYGFRDAHLLSAPLIIYNSTGEAQDESVRELGVQLRNIIQEGTGSEELHTYVNYAYGNEGPESWYGYESWRQEKLQTLKEKYDPEGKFSFYAPIA
ncbi:FAD-binding domain-containing protein [Stemphylium lycopersici]|uniref:FAD-binding domain-containing protein n=1 Tax=Stemphylium lycopersici TaxID=183478 RepID=A0A364MUQ0_STELY|nr:fad-dependent oxygenase [Stemphylium lycopersici]RAQ99144.1 FAD-binding domain-containing protein [Stemphylium lycopersici]RAR04154.1 FAD-binding domain-containing protein [Stemphylium lycopersici]